MKQIRFFTQSLIVLLFMLLALSVAAETVFDPSNIIFHFRGKFSDTKLGIYLCGLGDVNSDGFDDIAVSSYNPDGTHIFHGGDPQDSLPDSFLRGYVYTNGADLVDFTGDGIPDLLTAESGDRLLLYAGTGDSLESQPRDSLTPDTSVYAFGAPYPGYCSGDAFGDLLVIDREFPTNGRAYYYENPFVQNNDANWTYSREGHYISNLSAGGFIDFNGDSKLDIFLGIKADFDTSSWIYVFLGPQFAAEPDLVIAPPEGHDTLSSMGKKGFAGAVVNIGDADADTWPDLAVKYGATVFIYFMGPMADTLYDRHLINTAWRVAAGGDINGDGENDILRGEGISFNGGVDITLGGRHLDQYRDALIMREDLPPNWLDDIGRAVASAGDFNDDGYDDVLFSCDNFAYGQPGDVFVVSGGDMVSTGIEDDEPIFPEGYKLSHNYPNPFNPSTTIEFTLPSRCETNLTVYDIMGKPVRVLIDKTLARGDHRVSWDSCNEMGQSVASGVYLYRLVASGFTESRKMVLLK